jgi:hypothetical protein
MTWECRSCAPLAAEEQLCPELTKDQIHLHLAKLSPLFLHESSKLNFALGQPNRKFSFSTAFTHAPS